VLLVAAEGCSTPRWVATSNAPWQELDDIWLDRKHQRNLEMFVGQGFRPQARDPKTGYPTPEWKVGDRLVVSPP